MWMFVSVSSTEEKRKSVMEQTTGLDMSLISDGPYVHVAEMTMITPTSSMACVHLR